MVNEPGNRAEAYGGANEGIKSIKNVVSALRGFTFIAISDQSHAAPHKKSIKRTEKMTKESKRTGR
jgi:hypothetical protein